ncbi:anhydro-N-acetylmuramic acid kinase [Flavobacteriaceae bacterium SZ-1-7]|uniref:anhydro-N-acetylmuramic acid kinase n=1 Tax=Tamlana sedimenti TaxID=3134126 RepID=UPI00312368B4
MGLLFLLCMIKSEYHVVGVMSGTSLDGIDLVQVKFYFEGFWRFEILAAETIAYPKKWRDTLRNLVSLSLEDLKKIDEDYTEFLALTIKEFIFKNDIKNVDAICSHGHTALHQPEKRLTLQIGNLPEIAKILNEIVVCDFRVEDVKLGGQGAPLVPIGDKLLFSEYDFCLNLGGFANISTEIKQSRIAYDICPVNIVLNHYVSQLGFDFDDGGQIASSGKLDTTLLYQLNDLNFYAQKHPKSLGLEWVRTNIFPLIDIFKLEVKDVLNTFVEHIAVQIASVIKQKNDASVLVTGGGAYNKYLMERIKFHSKSKIIIPVNQVVEFKEALVFGFLGVLKLRGEVNCLHSVTGASKDHSSGIIYHP